MSQEKLPSISVEDRYKKEHREGNITFKLSEYTPNIQECKFLFLKMIDQAIRDIIIFDKSSAEEEKIIAQEARDFLFDEEYTIKWGDLYLSLENILDILDIEVEYFRQKIQQRLEEEI